MMTDLEAAAVLRRALKDEVRLSQALGWCPDGELAAAIERAIEVLELEVADG